MKKQLISLLILSFVLCACNKKVQETKEVSDTITETRTEVQDIIHRLPVMHVEDTVTSGSNVYVIMVNRESCDSLGIVTDELGYRYYDNLLKIYIKKNGSILFNKTFKKSDFIHFLDSEFAQHSILDGCRFIQVHEGMVTFSLAVSYPDSDMSCPFKLNIGQDGSYMIVKNDYIEEEYNIDSSND